MDPTVNYLSVSVYYLSFDQPNIYISIYSLYIYHPSIDPLSRIALQVSADWERASLHLGQQYSQQYHQPGSKPGPIAAATEGGGGGGFINTSLVGGDEESQEFDDLIFALKTGEDAIGFDCLLLVVR